MWFFDSGNPDEMTEWVKAIEAQIKKFLEESLLPKRNVSCPIHCLMWFELIVCTHNNCRLHTMKKQSPEYFP